MRLAFIGDIHLFRLWIAPWRLASKRLLGQANLLLRRRFKFDHRLIEPLMQRIASIHPDMLLFTGDLTTTALEEEFADFRQRFAPLLARFPTLIIPGNHDLYTRAAARGRLIERYFPDQVPQHFPLLKLLTARWSLLAVNAVRVRRLTARGRIGPEQLDEARKLVASLPPEQNLLVLCHYPMVLPTGVRDKSGHGLEDAAELQAVLRGGAGIPPGAAGSTRRTILYLHGHIHDPWYWQARDMGWDNLTTINAGAPCKIEAPFPAGQGFWQIDLADDAARPFHVLHHLPPPRATPHASKADWTTKAYPPAPEALPGTV